MTVVFKQCVKDNVSLRQKLQPVLSRVFSRVVLFQTIQFVPCSRKACSLISSALGNGIANNLVAVDGVLKDEPVVARDVLESFLETFRLILCGDTNGCDISDLADQDQLDPTLEFAVTAIAV